VVVVAPSRDEGSLVAESLRYLEPENAPVKSKRSLEIRDFQMRMPDLDCWMNLISVAGSNRHGG
jgi:hypothetical protein